MPNLTKTPSPCFVLDEQLLRKNLEIIADVRQRADVEIILALKACALWRIFPVIGEYISGATASSLAEARLVYEEMNTRSHTYAPVYTDRDFDALLRYSSHVTFNSPGQYRRFAPAALLRGISCGMRINPECSSVATALYNPCSPGSRPGVTAEELAQSSSREGFPEGLEGFHFHALCESGPEELRATLDAVEERFGRWLPQLRWINMGGGHLMTREGYDRELLIALLRSFKKRHPHLTVILEPGSAFTWRTGWLVSTVEDVVTNGGIRTAMLDVSFACHMPDCLEMPYKPAIVGARDPQPGDRPWRMGGNSCLAGDWIGDWAFPHGDPQPGDRIVFEDMIHYTMVKTTMFNGIHHPSIAILRPNGAVEVVREFGYEDFRGRMA